MCNYFIIKNINSTIENILPKIKTYIQSKLTLVVSYLIHAWHLKDMQVN
jgi:hypothetical protein